MVPMTAVAPPNRGHRNSLLIPEDSGVLIVFDASAVRRSLIADPRGVWTTPQPGGAMDAQKKAKIARIGRAINKKYASKEHKNVVAVFCFCGPTL